MDGENVKGQQSAEIAESFMNFITECTSSHLLLLAHTPDVYSSFVIAPRSAHKSVLLPLAGREPRIAASL